MKDRSFITLIGTLLLLLVLGGCEYTFIEPDTGDPVDPEVPISFSQEVEPIWTTQNCVACHNGSSQFSLKPGEAYQSLMTKDLVNSDSPADSDILTVPGTGLHNSKDYVGNQREVIRVWIEQGAQNN